MRNRRWPAFFRTSRFVWIGLGRLVRGGMWVGPRERGCAGVGVFGDKSFAERACRAERKCRPFPDYERIVRLRGTTASTVIMPKGSSIAAWDPSNSRRMAISPSRCRQSAPYRSGTARNRVSRSRSSRCTPLPICRQPPSPAPNAPLHEPDGRHRPQERTKRGVAGQRSFLSRSATTTPISWALHRAIVSLIVLRRWLPGVRRGRRTARSRIIPTESGS